MVVLIGVGAFGLMLSCGEGPRPPAQKAFLSQLSLGEDVFQVLCRRLAADAAAGDPVGLRYDALCAGLAEDPALQAKLAALLEERPALVEAFDRVLADADLADPLETFAEDELRQLLETLVPLYEPEQPRIPEVTHKAAAWLERLVDPADPQGAAALEALARAAPRQGYLAPGHALGVLRTPLAYPQLDGLVDGLLPMLAEGGAARSEWQRLLEALALQLALPASAADGEPTLDVALELLMRDDTAYAGGHASFFILPRDGRGMALPRPGPMGVPSPFADRDADGLADLNGQGRFVIDPAASDWVARGSLASPFFAGHDAPAMRDDQGRALDFSRADALPLYSYVDANRTLFAGLLREVAPLLAVEGDAHATVEKLLRGLPVWLGPVEERTRDFGAYTLTYPGYDTRQGALFDLVHAIGALLPHEETEQLIQLFEVLLRDHEPVMAALVDAMLEIDARADDHPEAVLQPDPSAPGGKAPHDFWDDLIALGEKVAKRSGSFEAVLRSLAEPDAAQMGRAMGGFMRYKDRVHYRGYPERDPALFNQAPDIAQFQVPVDRSQPDLADNESLFQRTIALIHDTAAPVGQCSKEDAEVLPTHPPGPDGAPIVDGSLSPDYPRCGFLEVYDLTELIARSIVGTAELAPKADQRFNLFLLSLVGALGGVTVPTEAGPFFEWQSQIDGLTTTPTAEALARFVFVPWNPFLEKLFEPVTTRDGVAAAERHAGTMLAWEVPVRPVADISWNQAQAPLIRALDPLEPRETVTEDWTLADGTGPFTYETEVLSDGYVIGELVSTLHMHWPSKHNERTQSEDPSAAFYAKQTNLVSYEALLSEALIEVDLQGKLHEMLRVAGDIEVAPGVDGLAVLAQAMERLLDPEKSCQDDCEATPLAKRDGSTSTTNNTGTETIAPLSPLYLVLDALKKIDAEFAKAENQRRHAAWLEARSDLVDRFLAVEDGPGGKRFRNRRTHQALLHTLHFVRERITAHRAQGDLERWATGLSARLEDTLSHPLAAAGLQLTDQTWEDRAAGEALLGLLGHMLGEAADPATFAASTAALLDLLQALRHDAVSTPILRFASLGLVPNAIAAVDEGAPPNLEDGLVDASLKLLLEVRELHPQTPSTMAKVVRNLAGSRVADGRSALQVLVDATTRVHRVDPALAPDEALSAEDYRQVFVAARDVLADERHGIERLIQVIRHRRLGAPEEAQP